MKLANEDLEPGIYGGSVTALKGLGRMFYVIDPDETSYKTTQQVPNFIQQVRSVISIDMCISLSEGILFSNRNCCFRSMQILAWHGEKSSFLPVILFRI